MGNMFEVAEAIRSAFDKHRQEKWGDAPLTPWDKLSFERRRKWIQMAEAAADALLEPCICDTGPNTDGPDEYCPRHGRTYNDMIEQYTTYVNQLRAEIERLKGSTKDEGPAF